MSLSRSEQSLRNEHTVLNSPTRAPDILASHQACCIPSCQHCDLQAQHQLPQMVSMSLHRRGHVCMIPGTKEFFIALVDHLEWGGAHTVWGEVSNPHCRTRRVSWYKQRGTLYLHPIPSMPEVSPCWLTLYWHIKIGAYSSSPSQSQSNSQTTLSLCRSICR